MATAMDDYLESPVEGAEAEENFPCKGCGEILEEGKAFELAGNRWHLNCFRCNTCSTLLDSDANLLLLGDGSLICNNCTYSCGACGNKIEDLAILTGDQAFCATCFRCRNCKRKIENLRYARTSQGIFCMSCHESLMARRRKKSKAAAQAKAREKEGASPMVVDKSLPALPPNAIPNGAFSDTRVEPDSDTPTELSPRPRQPQHVNEARGGERRPSESLSPNRQRPDHGGKDGFPLPPPGPYRNHRNSSVFSAGDVPTAAAGADDQGYFMPIPLDPSPLPATAPPTSEPTKHFKDHDYFGASKSAAGSDRGRQADGAGSTPHIAFQEKSRQPSSDYESEPIRSESRKVARSGQSGPSPTGTENHPSLRKDETPTRKGPDGTPRSSQDSRRRDDDEVRSNDSSLASSSGQSRATSRKDAHAYAPRAGTASRTKTSDDLVASGRPGPESEPKSSESYMSPRAPPQPPRPSLAMSSQGTTGRDLARVTTGMGMGMGVGMGMGMGSEKTSPKLPEYNAAGDFSLEEDMERILGADNQSPSSSSLMRRVSNAVRHGRTSSGAEQYNNAARASHNRSVSESTKVTLSPRWPKPGTAEDNKMNAMGQELLSPNQYLSVEEAVLLRSRLQDSEDRVAELEQQFGREHDLKTLNQKLEEKRRTVSVLDTQTEIMIRQLEVLACYVERAKESNRPLDGRQLEEMALKEFTHKLDRLKQSMTMSLEQLHEERDEIVEEKKLAMLERDRALVEFEQLSLKNAQLADMNNDLTHQLQERFKTHSSEGVPPPPPLNGLGIYSQQSQHHRSGTSHNSANLEATATTFMPEHEEATIESGPTVVNIRKGKVQKFSWKKGSKAMAQGIAKGVGRATGLQHPEHRRDQASDNIGLPYNMTHPPVDAPVQQGQLAPSASVGVIGQGRSANDPGRQGFFGFKKQTAMAKSMSTNNMSNYATPEPASVLFGSDLSERAEYERRQIPCVVTRCIEEVELRGMDMEGIYRKTGGNSQVRMVQDGFDKNENFDISDPDIDITAVTSVLKQYFRKLPVPLLTYEVYDSILETNSFSGDEHKCAHLRKTFNLLPQKHRDCLEFLMFHLARVAKREQENLMSPKNLAVVFAPTIMRGQDISREMTDTHNKNHAVQFIIENSHTIFSED